MSGVRWVVGAVCAGAVALLAGCGDQEPRSQTAAQPSQQATDPCAPGSPLQRSLERRAREEARRVKARHPHAHFGAFNSGCASIRIRVGQEQ